jgi:hypothetical protein
MREEASSPRVLEPVVLPMADPSRLSVRSATAARIPQHLGWQQFFDERNIDLRQGREDLVIVRERAELIAADQQFPAETE